MKRPVRSSHSWEISVESAAYFGPSYIDNMRAQGYLIHREERLDGSYWIGVMPAVTKERAEHEAWIERPNEPVTGTPKIRDLLSDESKWSPLYWALDERCNALSLNDREDVYQRGARWTIRSLARRLQSAC